jgi:PAS domain S-box-containing protein
MQQLSSFWLFPTASTKIPLWLRYGVATIIVALALWLTWQFPAIRSGSPFLFFFLAVPISAWVSGLGPGLLTIVLAAVSVVVWVFPPFGSISFSEWRTAPLVGFLAVAGALCFLVFGLQGALRREFTQRERLRITLTSIGDAVIATDATGNVMMLNGVAAKLTGWIDEEARGKPLKEIFVIVNEDSRAPVENPVDRVLVEGRIVGLANHTVLIAKDGSECPIDDSAAPIRDEVGKLVGAVLVFRDISERKKAEASLRQLNAELEQRIAERTADLERRTQELDQFVYVASHDLKMPLRGITHLANWIVEDAAPILPPASRQHLDSLLGRVRLMNKLLDELLVYARANRHGSAHEWVDVPALIDEIRELLAPPHFTVTVVEPVPALYTELVPLSTVLRNLVANAIQHHERDDGHIQVSARDSGDFVEFQVADDGPGIAPEHHRRIFEMFQILQPHDHPESSGMGLPVVKRIVEAYGGRIWLESGLGQGTTFHFTWPKGSPPA